MMNFSTRETHAVNITWLPSRGRAYPDTLEIYVTPLTIKENKLLEGASLAEYYRRMLDGVVLKGPAFKPKDLLFCDIQFLDLVRRIFSFEINKEITVVDYPCYHCKTKDIKASFKLTDIEFSELKEELFGTTKSYTDNETGEVTEVTIPGKQYRFTDGTEIVVAPITVGDFIEMAAKYVSNAAEDAAFYNRQMTNAYIGSFTYLIKSITGKEFKDETAKREYLFNYIGDLYKNADKKVLEDIQADVSCDISPIKAICPNCDKEVEVYVHPSLTFRQDD